MPENFKISVVRFDPSKDKKPYTQEFLVPNNPANTSMTALKALHYINRYLEPIAYDYNCRRGSCGRCAMMIDGVPRLACYFELEGSHTLEPLAGCPVVRDLVVDKSELTAQFVAVSALIDSIGSRKVMQPISGPFWRDVIFPINACRECMCCYAACSVYGAEESAEFVGPGALQRAFLRTLDGQDAAQHMRQVLKNKVRDCTQCGMCTLVCPARITCTENIKALL